MDGTIKNEIQLFKGTSVYRGIIEDSVSERKGKRIADQWKNKINAIIGKDFEVKKIDWMDNSIKYGWNLEYGNLWININLIPFFGDNSSSLFFVELRSAYFSYKLK
jgi:hypothetical protein